MTRIIERLADVAGDYDALFCDLWGCLHDGVRAFPAAVAALLTYRAQGGTVVLLTNAPRPRSSVAAQMAAMGVPEDAWDTIATSGDSARAAMFQGVVGTDVFHIGETRDTAFFEPLGIVPDPVALRLVPLEEAEGIVCTGPFDPLADPDVLRPQLLYAKAKGLVLLNANPDIQVDRGAVREWCGGAVARLYDSMGGQTLAFGKPHPPVYDLARRRLLELGVDIPDERILCIGDGIATDIQGAQGEGMDSLFITGGLAAVETGTDHHPDADRLADFAAAQQIVPRYAMGFLR